MPLLQYHRFVNSSKKNMILLFEILFLTCCFWQSSLAFSPTTKTNTASLMNSKTKTTLWYLNDNNSNTFHVDNGSEFVRNAFLTKNHYHHPKAKEWIERSINYYSKVMREERRRNAGQVTNYESMEYQEDFIQMANKHYYVLRKIKDGKYQHAEILYRRIINEIMVQEEKASDVDTDNNSSHCKHAQLAITTLLLALHTQRMKDNKKTRSVFLNFFRLVVVNNEDNNNNHQECACSAKVLQAYALFEMKQGNKLKSLEIVNKALQFDKTLQPILQWKQFKDVFLLQQQQQQQRQQRKVQ